MGIVLQCITLLSETSNKLLYNTAEVPEIGLVQTKED